MDHTSQLPTEALERILFFLPTKDAGRATILSKSWLHAWESLPTRQFSFHQKKPSRDQEKSDEEIEKFLDFVDESLSILSQYKVIVENFELKMFMCHCNEYTSRVDEWMSLLSRNCVKVLDIDFTGSIFSDTRKLFYSLPQTTFFIKSLVELRLKGCRFGKDILGDNVNFVSMRDLHLESASLDEQTVRTVEKLVNSCPLLEKFSLESDTTLAFFQFLELRRLRFVKVCTCKTILIKESLLQSPELCDTLTLIVLNFVSLEISSGRLKKLNLSCFELGKNKVIIDAPKLCSFKFEGMQTPSFVFKNYFCLQEVQLVIRISFNDLDNTWFLKLRKDLAMLSKYLVVVTLDLFLGHVNAKFTRMHLDGSLRPSPHSLNCLKLNRVPSTIDYSAFIEGLLWSCYPKNLLVDLHQQQDQKFIEFLYATLTSRDENPSCCKDIKACICWRHFLDNVKVVTDTSEGIRYGLHRNALDKTAVGEGSYLTFQLEWRERSKLHSSQFDKWPFSTKFRKALCFT